MSMVRKLHPHDTETIKEFEDYSVDDILSVAGILKLGEAQELLDHIQESREGWRKCL